MHFNNCFLRVSYSKIYNRIDIDGPYFGLSESSLLVISGGDAYWAYGEGANGYVLGVRSYGEGTESSGVVQITQDLSVSSSIALDSSKQPIIRVEWQATNTIFVQLIRDENGILSISVRRRQRL